MVGKTAVSFMFFSPPFFCRQMNLEDETDVGNNGTEIINSMISRYVCSQCCCQLNA